MITFKNSILIFLTAIILVFLLGANHAALAKLPDWEITVHQNLGLYWVSAVQPAAGDRYDEIKNFGIDYEPKLKAEDDADYSATKSYFPAKDTSFTLKNMSPGDKDNSTITITNEADFPVELELLVGCLKGHEIGHFDDGHVEEVILAQKLDMKTFIDGVELETSPGISFPNNKILTVDSFAGDKYETITVNRITGVDISEKIDLKVGAIIGKRTFPKQLQPGERVRVRIEIELDGPTTGNEFQNKEAQFVWVFTATEMPPGHEPGDDDPDTDGDGDADSDGDTDRRRDNDTDRRTDIPGTQPPGGGFDNIPEPAETVDIPEPDVPLVGFMPKTGEAPLWYSVAPGCALILLGLTMLLKRKKSAAK